MTKEQEKVIECFKEIIKQTEEANECGLSTNDFSEEIRIYYEVLNLIQQLQKESEKKDKIIDLMAKEINKTDRGYYDYCNSTKECTGEECVNCIKQYFEKKAK